LEEEGVYELEGERHVGPPPANTEVDHIEQLMDVPETNFSTISNLKRTIENFCHTCTKENV
jgi:hypothetical protein